MPGHTIAAAAKVTAWASSTTEKRGGDMFAATTVTNDQGPVRARATAHPRPPITYESTRRAGTRTRRLSRRLPGKRHMHSVPAYPAVC